MRMWVQVPRESRRGRLILWSLIAGHHESPDMGTRAAKPLKLWALFPAPSMYWVWKDMTRDELLQFCLGLCCILLFCSVENHFILLFYRLGLVLIFLFVIFPISGGYSLTLGGVGKAKVREAEDTVCTWICRWLAGNLSACPRWRLLNRDSGM